MKIWNFLKKNVYIKHALMAIAIFVLLTTLTLFWLNTYTQHGEVVIVPNVKGLQIEKAIPFLEKNQLRYAVIDSSYVKNAAPGSVTETTPKGGTKVKKNRIVYIIVNAFSIKTVTVPEVVDLSQRQALAMLNSIGLKNINIEYVPGAYNELVVGLKCRGENMPAGAKISIDSYLTLLVSTGMSETISDSVDTEAIPEETGF